MAEAYTERPIAGESYQATEADRRQEVVERERRGPNLLLLILFVILGVILVGALAYFIYRSVRGPETPPLSAQGTPPAATAQPAQPATPTPPAQPAPAAAPTEPAAPQQGSGGQASVKGPTGEAETVASGGVTYRIKRGDTLWDISATYYRNPWLYRKLARANSIRNPDLIFAGARLYIPAN